MQREGPSKGNTWRAEDGPAGAAVGPVGLEMRPRVRSPPAGPARWPKHGHRQPASFNLQKSWLIRSEENEEKSLSGYHACPVHEPATPYAVAPKINQYNCGYLSDDDQSEAHGVF
jgi:hypothetical protein